MLREGSGVPLGSDPLLFMVLLLPNTSGIIFDSPSLRAVDRCRNRSVYQGSVDLTSDGAWLECSQRLSGVQRSGCSRSATVAVCSWCGTGSTSTSKEW